MMLSLAAWQAILQGRIKPTHALPTMQSIGTRKSNGSKPQAVGFIGKLQQWYHPVSCEVKHTRIRSRNKRHEGVGHPPSVYYSAAWYVLAHPQDVTNFVSGLLKGMKSPLTSAAGFAGAAINYVFFNPSQPPTN
jgi:hypothetical protein